MLYPRILITVFTACLALGLCACEGVIGDAAPPREFEPPPVLGIAGNGRLPTRVWRLTPAQFEREARRVLGDLPDAGRYPVGAPEHGFSNSASRSSFDDVATDRLATISAAYAEWVADNSESVIGCPLGSCTDEFIEWFTQSAYRRPLSSEERDALRALYDTSAAAHDHRRATRDLVQAVLMSPHMVYRTGVGAPFDGPTTGEPGEGETIVVLSNHEIADLLAFSLTDESPDAELMADADAGRLRDAEVRAGHARRLMARSHGMWRRFFSEWLDMSRFDTQVTAVDLPAPIRSAMLEEFDEFVGRVVVDGRGTFNDVLTSSRSYANPDLAAFYGVAHSGEGVQPIEFDPSERAGILSQGLYLVSHGSREDEFVVRRGMGIYRRMYCEDLETPEGVDVLAEQSRLTPADASVREKTDARSSTNQCGRCHQIPDPIGLAFETFDSQGRARTEYLDGSPIDSVATVPGIGDVDSVSVLGAGLAANTTVRACFARRVAQSLLGADLGWESQWLNDAQDAWESDDRIESLVVGLVSHPAFIERARGAE